MSKTTIHLYTHSFCLKCAHTLFPFLIYTSILIVPLQTRDALNEEVTKQGLNVIHTVSFPTNQNLKPFVQNLKVGDWNKYWTTWVLLGNRSIFHTPIGVKWKDHFPKLLPRICTWDSLPSKYWLVPHLSSKYWPCLPMCCRPPHWAWCHQGMHGSHTNGFMKTFGSRTEAMEQPTRSLISVAESRLWAL